MAANPIQRHILRAIQAAGGWNVVIERIASGETVAEVARDYLRPDGVPISRSFFSNLLHADPMRSKRVFEARTEGAAAMVDRALQLVDSAAVDRDSVNKAKVQAETRIKIAGFVDRASWGEQKQQVNVQVNVADLHLDALRTRQVGASGVIREMADRRGQQLVRETAEHLAAGIRQIAGSSAGARETAVSVTATTLTSDSRGDS